MIQQHIDSHPHMDIFQNWGPSDISWYITLSATSFLSFSDFPLRWSFKQHFFLERNSIKVTWLQRDQQRRSHQMSIIAGLCTHAQSESMLMKNIWNTSTVILIRNTIFYFPLNKHILRVKCLNLLLAIN